MFPLKKHTCSSGIPELLRYMNIRWVTWTHKTCGHICRWHRGVIKAACSHQNNERVHVGIVSFKWSKHDVQRCWKRSWAENIKYPTSGQFGSEMPVSLSAFLPFTRWSLGAPASCPGCCSRKASWGRQSPRRGARADSPSPALTSAGWLWAAFPKPVTNKQSQWGLHVITQAGLWGTFVHSWA